jgi:fucose 4-O-acetylase-like acetyltransferase
VPATTKRFESIDICRGIGIIIVLYMHVLEISFWGVSGLKDTQYAVQMQFFSSFIMSLFFLISGLVSHHRDWRKTFYTSLYLIVIAISVQILGWLIITLIRGNEHQTALSMMKSFFKPLITLSDFNISVMWFFITLAFVKIAYEGIIRSNLVGRVIIILAIIGFYLVNRVTGKLYFEIGAVLPAFIFYALGQYLGKSIIQKIESRATLLKFIVIFSAAIFLALFNHGGQAPFDYGGLVNPFANNPDFWVDFEIMIATGDVGFFPFFILSGFLGSCAVLCGAVIIFRNYNKVSSVLSKVGTHTIELLIINGILIESIPWQLSRILGLKNDGFSPIILALTLTLIQLVLLPLWIKILSPLMTACRAISQGIMARAARFV